MKKFLSLVLALVMTMSLVTIASAKDFTDDGKITYKEAVDVMSTVEVVDGYADGNFNPANTLTRGAAAKIICNMILGPTTASALTANAAVFTDVAVNHTFAGYIAYCSQQGIINGYSDGTFRPANTLTGYQFMKMLLGALGYDGTVEGFTGANWTINVAKLALGAGLNDGLKDAFVGSKAVTREEACLYALNTLQATMVQYDSKTNIVIGDAQISIGSKAENVPQTGYKDVYESDKSETDRTLQFSEKYFPKLKLSKDGDVLGRKANTWTYKNAEVGTYTTDDALLVYTSDMSSTANKSVIAKALKGYNLKNVAVYTNGYVETDNGDVVTTELTTAAIAEMTGNGILVEVYADGTDVTDVVVVNSYVGKVTKVNNTDETITIELLSNSTKFTTENGYGTYAKDEYVMVSPVFSNATTISTDPTDKEDAVIAATEKVTGKVTGSSSSKVVVDGTTYKAAEITEYTSAANLKDNIDVYLDAYGYVVYTSSVAAKDFLYLVDAYEKEDNYGVSSVYAQLVNTSGEVKDYKLVQIGDTEISDDATDVTTAMKGKLYSYTLSNNKVTLTAADVADSSNEHYVTYFGDGSNGVVSSDTTKLGSRYFADDTVFISVKDSLGELKVTVSTGKQLVKDAAAKYAIITSAEKKSTANADMAVVFVNAASVTDSSDLIMVKDASRVGVEDLKDTEYDTFDVYVNGEAQTIAIDTDASDTLYDGVLYTYGKNDDGAYVLTAKVEHTDYVGFNDQVTEVYKSWITVSGCGTLDASDATIVDLTDNDVEDLGALKDLVGVKGTKVYVSVVYDKDDNASMIYITDATADFTAAEGVYTLNETFDDEVLSSISYKESGVTKVVSDDHFTATEFKSVKVSTVDGWTFTGVYATV